MEGEVDTHMSRQLDIKRAGPGRGLQQREAGEQGVVPEATGWVARAGWCWWSTDLLLFKSEEGG